MLEEAAGGKFFRKHQRGAAMKHRKSAQGLRRIPAERAKVVEPVICRDAETFGQRADIQKKLAIVEDDAFRRGAGSRRKQNDRVVIGAGGNLRFSRRTARQLVKQRSRLGPVPAAQPQARYLGAFDKIVEPEAVLVKDEAWPQP